jgi:signal transduction histidine kinase
VSEEALVAMSGLLIAAQEEERVRIARDLHDDLSQRMALLSIGLEQFEQGMPDLSSDARQQIQGVSELASEVSSTLHDLTHQLHPFRLDSLGLVSSVGGLCRELSNQHNLRVQFVHSDIPRQIPKDVTLCLFRIVQEALRNVIKHSGAAEAKVELIGRGDNIELGIFDCGTGFNVEAVRGKGGLGLISMRERLRLVGGHFSIDSEPDRGTRIRVRIPEAIKQVEAGAYNESNMPNS